MSAEALMANKVLRQVSSKMHSQWWAKLELERLQHLSEANALVSRRLDNVILSRMNYQSLWIDNPSEEMQTWLPVLPRISLLSTAAGLLTQNCPDYLWDSSYRKALLEKFNQPQVEQLIALWPAGSEPPVWSANNVLEQAELFSACALYHAWKDQPFWPLFRLSLPVIEKTMTLTQDDIKRVVDWIFRLERFL